MNDIAWLVIWVVLIGGTFAFLWYKGHLASITAYVQQTREELRKCTWPTWEELKGSTVVVTVSIILLGSFVVAVDFVFTLFVRWVT